MVTRRVVLAGLAAGAVTGRKRPRSGSAGAVTAGGGVTAPVARGGVTVPLTILNTGTFNNASGFTAGVAASSAAALTAGGGPGGPMLRGTPHYTSSGSSSSGTTFTVAKDAGVVAGDVILVFMVWNGTGTTPSITGFTAYPKAVNTFGIALFSRTADGSEGSTFTVNFAAGFNFAAVCAAYQGSNGVFDPVPPDSGSVLIGTTLIDIPGVTTIGTNDALVWFGAVRSSGGGAAAPSITVPASLAQEGSQSSSTNAAGANLGVLVADRWSGAPGATGNMTGTSSVSDNVGGVLVALQQLGGPVNAYAGVAAADASAAVNDPAANPFAYAGLASATGVAQVASTGGATNASARLASASGSVGQATPTPRAFYDSTYVGWQFMQTNHIGQPPEIFAYGPAWTTAQIATLPAGTVHIPLYTNTSQSASTTRVIDVENSCIGAVNYPSTYVSIIAAWINARNALPGGYAVNRPTVYLNVSGLYYVGFADDVITPLANTYGLVVGTDYDIWIAHATGTQPSGPTLTNGVPAVATQWQNYTQSGASYDKNSIWDPTWFPAGS